MRRTVAEGELTATNCSLTVEAKAIEKTKRTFCRGITAQRRAAVVGGAGRLQAAANQRVAKQSNRITLEETKRQNQAWLSLNPPPLTFVFSVMYAWASASEAGRLMLCSKPTTGRRE
eukprot:SAG11_NODE_2093_length_3834_cov_2.402945_3_plen_117_part_00